MTPRNAALLTVLAALIAACATPQAPRTPEPACAQPPGEEEQKDGGLGGTGNAPDPCAAAPAGS